MKETVVLTLPEIQEALVVYMGTRPSNLRKYVAHVEFAVDPQNDSEALRLRANVILFDTKANALAFVQEMMKPVPTVEELNERTEGA